MSLRSRFMIRILISPILIVLICSRKLIDTRFLAFRPLHHLNVLVHVDGICFAILCELIEGDALFGYGPNWSKLLPCSERVKRIVGGFGLHIWEGILLCFDPVQWDQVQVRVTLDHLE
jgi:hypothetical protein